MERWNGKVALVSGATSGIGRAVAARLAAGGMSVVATGRREDRLTGLASELGKNLTPVAADLRDERSISRLFERARGTHGGVDVLVNAAGLGRHAPLLNGATDAWREMLEVNVLALAVLTREAVRDMRERGDDGHVIHLSSMAAHRVPEESGLYSATKFAVRSLTEGLRRELRAAGSGIRVTSISPGFVETEFAERYWGDPAAAERTYGRYRVLDAEDVADLVEMTLTRPAHVQLHDVLVRPTDQPD